MAFCGDSVWPVVSICSALCWSVRRGTRWVPPAPGKMPTLTSGSAILTLSPSAATRPWQASDSSKAPPMQVPLIAETQGLPQVSSLRNSQVMRPAPSKSIFVGGVAILGPRLLEDAEHALQHVEVGAAGEAVLAGGDDRALDRRVGDDGATILSSSSITSSVKTFIERSGMFQVTSAMPSASVSTVKFM